MSTMLYPAPKGLKFSMTYSMHSQGQADTSAKTFTPNVRSEEISLKDSPQVPGDL